MGEKAIDADHTRIKVEQDLAAGRSARKMIKGLFKTLTLRIAVQPAMMAMQGFMQGMLGSFAATAPMYSIASAVPGLTLSMW